MTPDDPRHGTNAGFFAHSRADQQPCPDCYAAKNRKLKDLRVYGQTRLTALGDEAWSRLQVIPQGVLSELTGAQPRCLRALRDGTPEGRVTNSVKNRILNAPLLTAVGVTRKLQALAAIGWSLGELAKLSDLHMRVIAKRRLSTSDSYIETHTVFEIDRLYRSLHMTPAPLTGPSQQTISNAELKGWLAPLSWNNIDDPDERPHVRDTRPLKTDVDPVVVQRVLAGDRLPTTAAEKREIAAHWGRSQKELEQLTGWNVARMLRETREAS